MSDDTDPDDEAILDELGIDMPDLDGPSVDQNTVDAAEHAGEQTGHWLAYLAWLPFSFLGGILWGVLGRLPAKESVYRKLIKLGYSALYENTGAHVIVNTVYGDGEMVPRPGEVSKEGIETNNGERWTVDGQLAEFRIGDAPVVTGVADDHELVDPIQARIAEAVDLSPRRYRHVSQTPSGYEPVVYDDPLREDTPQQAPVADGGSAQVAEIQSLIQGVAAGEYDVEEATTALASYVSQIREAALDAAETITLEPSSTFDDIWIDTSNPEPSNDGWIVSMRKGYELHWDQAGSEEMQNQETRGRLAEVDPDKASRRQWIMVMAFAGGCILGAVIAIVATGDGGGSLPSIGLMTGWIPW